MKNWSLLGIVCFVSVSVMSACPNNILQSSSCTSDSECATGQFCSNGECIGGRADSGNTIVACTDDSQCRAINPDYYCNSQGLCDVQGGGDPCTTTAECPLDQFCNFQSQVCIPLQPGFCREQSQCNGQQCSATPGGVGRCVECLDNSHCSGGVCTANGTCDTTGECNPACGAGYRCDLGQCVPISSDCNPPCLTTETCTQGVCYGANGCPRHAHPVDGQCICDDNYVPSPSGNGCVPEGGSCDADAQLACQQQGGTWDSVNCTCLSGGTCDPPCGGGFTCQGTVCVPLSSSCTTDFECKNGSFTSAFVCDPETNTCTCNALAGLMGCIIAGLEFDSVACDCDWSSQTQPDAGGYDAAPPVDSALPDTYTPPPPDAGQPEDASGHDVVPEDAAEVDFCEQQQYYGDGECDYICEQPDPDCVGIGGSACTDSTDCTFSSNAYCLDHWAGGYCGAECDPDWDSCGQDAVCVCVDRGIFGCYEAYCYGNCDFWDMCRDGYECKDVRGDKICNPVH